MSSTNVSWEDLKDGYTKQFIDRLMLASRVRRNNCASSEALAATHNQVSQRLKTDTSSASATSKKEWEEKSVSAWSERGVLIQDVKAKISKITGGATDGGGEDAAGTAGDVSETPYDLEEQAKIIGDFSAHVTIIDDAIKELS